jgi:hypothetical protein
MKYILRSIEHFLFAPVSNVGFSLMRIAWGIQEFITFSTQWMYADMYYATNDVLGAITCRTPACSLQQVLFSPMMIHIVFTVLLLVLLGAIIGFYPRICITIALCIIFVLQERNGLILNGGDRIEKIIGFYLLIAPSCHAFSIRPIKRAWNQQWVRRLLLWQLIILYASAGLHKLQVTGWLNGHKIGLSLHLEQFLRFPMNTLSIFEPLYTTIGIVTISVQIAWLLLLIPKNFRQKFIIKRFPLSLKQCVLFGTTGMHLSILLFMDIDMFAITMLISYLGLLEDGDLAFAQSIYRRIWNKKHSLQMV